MIGKLLPASELGSTLLGLILREIVTTCVFQPLLANGEPDLVAWFAIKGLAPVAGIAPQTLHDP
jgi:hypothetical protein